MRLGHFFSPTNFFRRRKREEFHPATHGLRCGTPRGRRENYVAHPGIWAEFTGLTKLCFGGGMSHNSSLNGMILRSGMFR